MALLRPLPPLQLRLLARRLFSASALRHRSHSLSILSRSNSRRLSSTTSSLLITRTPRNATGLRAFISTTTTASESLQEKPAVPSAYGSEQIQVLEGLEAVRKRPAMYIGSTGPRGLHHLVYEILDNAIDEAQAGYASRVDVVFHEDNSVSVTDNGRGIPTDLHPATKKSSLETVLTALWREDELVLALGEFLLGRYKVCSGSSDHSTGVWCLPGGAKINPNAVNVPDV